MQEEIAKGFVVVAKCIAYNILWSLVLFYVGLAALRLVTLGQYPWGLDVQRHTKQIALVGLLVLVLAWSLVAVYNNTLGVDA